MLLLLVAMTTATLADLAEVQPPRSGMVDAVEFADSATEAAHGFRCGGEVSRAVAGDIVGGHDMRRTARILKSEGDWISFDIALRPNTINTLEIEELHGRDGGVRGYQILVDDEPVFFRTWEARGAGPVHYFVQLPPGEKTSATVRLVNHGTTPVAIGRVWVFADLDQHVQDHGLEAPFFIAPTLRLSFSDMEADVAKVRQIRDSLGDHPHVKPAWTTWVGYAQLTDREIVRQIDHILDVAAATALPVQISLDTWWAQTPLGLDGRGGSWVDIPYQQVVYNQTQQRFQLSIPNHWASTPWLTVNHPHLNEFKARRMRFAASHLAKRCRELLAEGRENLILAINLDNEPVYWASGNAGLGSDLLLADFNSATVEQARLDGVTLDPKAGLDHAARLWLARNLLNYNTLIARAAAEALGRDAVIVDAAGARPAGDLLRHNVYTQAWIDNVDLMYPMLDRRWPFWETAAPAGPRVGGEWNSDSSRVIQQVMHQLPLGRSAAVNAECGNDAQQTAAVRPAYALGQRYLALYNYPLDQVHVAAAELADLSRPMPPLVYHPVLFETRFDRDDWRQQVRSHENIQTGLIGNTAAVAAFVQSNESPGVLTYQLPAPGGRFGGLAVELSGRAFVHRSENPAVHVRVLAGDADDPAEMREAGRFHDSGDLGRVHRFDLTDRAKDRPHVFVRIELHATQLPESVLSWCSIYLVRFTTPWPAELMRELPPQDHSLAALRRQNLLVSWRRDAELAIASLQEHLRASDPAEAAWNLQGPHAPGGKLNAARAAHARGSYAQAYRLANEGLCVIPPATFHVMAARSLDPFPIQLRAPEPVTVTVKQWKPELMRLRLRAEHAGEAPITIAGLPPHTPYAIVQEDDVWCIQPAAAELPSAHVTDENGTLTASLAITPSTGDLREPSITGLLAGRDARSIHLLRSDGHGAVRLTLNPDARIMREAAEPIGLDELHRGDHIVVALDDDYRAIEVIAAFALVEGTVSRIEQATPFSMPAITIEETGTRHIIDLTAALHLGQTTLTLRSNPLQPIDLAPGQEVKLRVNPATGRVFHLWANLP